MFSGGPGALVQYGLRSKVSPMSLASRKDIQSAKSLVIRQYLKTGVSRKQSTPNFPKNEHFLPPDTHGVRYVRFSENLACFFFLKNPIWDSSVLPYYRQSQLDQFSIQKFEKVN